ncbi:MAG: UDP-3-O-(3-hydroxymyristoyl)glucosamine N-acyltransferase [Alphaproteobacteria bacterium]|nr:UDP-3-O-(3-hydroxymyristoyl)glucosamine N-acyltransferase [Alphaproteobacteria bacterium]
MTDSRFFTASGPFTLAELADISGAELIEGASSDKKFFDVASLDKAKDNEVSFLYNKALLENFKSSDAGACFVHKKHADNAPEGMALLISDDPQRSYALAANAFYPVKAPVPNIAPSAVVDDKAKIEKDVRIEAGAVIAVNAEIGHRCHIFPNVVIGEGVIIGDDCVIGAGASLSHCMLGNKVYVYTGVRIGQDGFGFVMSEDGHLKIPQLGRVVIGNDVEIGANTCIDRGACGDTKIDSGCRIDNLVQIGHNVHLGCGCVIVAQVGISGSTKFEDFAAAGGQSGFAEHLNIGVGARIAAQSGVMRNVPAGVSVMGTPAIPMKEYMRQVATLGRMSRNKPK